MKVRRDLRLHALLVTVGAAGVAGLVFALLPGSGIEVPAARSSAESELVQYKALKPFRENMAAEIEHYFRQGVTMLHAGKHQDAVLAFHQVLERSPKLPDAHVNMGFALLGQDRYAIAGDFFRSAIDLEPRQANAYYGLAIVLEKLCDLAGARGAMRTYLHLAPHDDKFTPKARAALWEWDPKRPSTGCAGRGTTVGVEFKHP